MSPAQLLPCLLASVTLCTAGPAAFLQQQWYDLPQFDRRAQFAYIKELEKPQEVSTKEFTTDGQGIGQVTGVDIDSKGDLFVFHRANTPWSEKTFETNTDVLSEASRVPIKNDTIFKLNPSSGEVIAKLGANFFNVPHGLSIDVNDSLWVTDVGRHQIFRFPKDSASPDLVLGEKFVPGSDNTHFCKPTDVAVASNGDFFVADGYCNSRIMKFDSSGSFVRQWGTKSGYYGLTEFSLSIPHSLTLVEELDLVCVADRENERALCYNAGVSSTREAGAYNRTLVKPGEMGKVFALYYNEAVKEIEAAAEISQEAFIENGMAMFPPRAFSYSLNGDQLQEWAYITMAVHMDGPSLIHDLCTSKDGQDFFLGDVYQQRVVKYTKKFPARDILF